MSALALVGSIGSGARRLLQAGAALEISAWPNAGSAGSVVSSTAVLGAGGSVQLSNSSGTPYVELTSAYLELSGTLAWDTTAGGGWTVMAVVSAPASGVPYERVLEFCKAGTTSVDAVMLGRDDTPGGAAYAVTGPGGARDRPVFAGFGAGVFGGGWRVLTATTNASSWALLLDGAVVASGNTSTPVASRTTDQGYIGKSSNANIGLASGLRIRQLSVWFEPLTVPQLADLHAYVGGVWGIAVAAPAPSPPSPPARPPPPDTCGTLPGGWRSHCPSCAAGTGCLRSSCTTGLKVGGQAAAESFCSSHQCHIAVFTHSRSDLLDADRPMLCCRWLLAIRLLEAPTSAACRLALAPATPRQPAPAAWPRLTWLTGRPALPAQAPSAAPSPCSPPPRATWS
jgi:hypothetical protein